MKDGDRFWKIAECYIRGNTIKYLRLPEDILGLVKEDINEKPSRSGPPPRRPFRGRNDGGRGGKFKRLFIIFLYFEFILIGHGNRTGGGGGGGGDRNNYKGGGGGRGGHQGSRGGGRGGGQQGGQFRQGR